MPLPLPTAPAWLHALVPVYTDPQTFEADAPIHPLASAAPSPARTVVLASAAKLRRTRIPRPEPAAVLEV